MANTLQLIRNGAVGFIDWLDVREVIIKFALADITCPPQTQDIVLRHNQRDVEIPRLSIDATVVTGGRVARYLLPVLFLILHSERGQKFLPATLKLF